MKRGRFAEEQVIGVLIEVDTEVDTPITGQRVLRVLERIWETHGLPGSRPWTMDRGSPARRWRPGRGEYG